MTSRMDLENMRRYVEREEGWRDISTTLPYISFPPEWEVKILPPMGGAMARFLVRAPWTDGRTVSVYLDTHDRLGWVGQPYWEIYPNVDDDCTRYLLAEVADMLAGIEASLAQMRTDKEANNDQH